MFFKYRIRSLKRTLRPPVLRTTSLASLDLLAIQKLRGRGLTPLHLVRRVKEFNNNLTENWVAYAKSPSDFPNFAQIEFFSSEILGLPKISRKNPTSFKTDVKLNKFEVLKTEEGSFPNCN